MLTLYQKTGQIFKQYSQDVVYADTLLNEHALPTEPEQSRMKAWQKWRKSLLYMTQFLFTQSWLI